MYRFKSFRKMNEQLQISVFCTERSQNQKHNLQKFTNTKAIYKMEVGLWMVCEGYTITVSPLKASDVYKKILIKMPTKNENYSTMKNVCFKAVQTPKTKLPGIQTQTHFTLFTYRHLEKLNSTHTLNIVQYMNEKNPPTHKQTD